MKTTPKLALLLALIALPAATFLPTAEALACGTVRKCLPLQVYPCPGQHLLDTEPDDDIEGLGRTLSAKCNGLMDYGIGDPPGGVEPPPSDMPNYDYRACGLPPPEESHILLRGDLTSQGYRFTVDVYVCLRLGDKIVGSPSVTAADGYRPTWVQQGPSHFVVYNQDHLRHQVTFCVDTKLGDHLCRTWWQWN